MQASYLLRVVCLVLCGAGVLQIAFEYTALLPASLLLRATQAGNARKLEGFLFRLTLGARLLPWLLALGLLLPAYLRGEDNFAAERVGTASLLLSAVLLCWWGLSCLRISLAAYRTHRCCRHYPQIGPGPQGVPMLLYPGERPVMAVAGLFSARILVSQPLLDRNRFSGAALDVAFAHESAHARHSDNLKALTLAILPHIPAFTKHFSSLAGYWRRAAEMAADEEGTGGKPEQSLLLAEMIVALAREGNQRLPQGSIALCSDSHNLKVRVERLLRCVESPLPDGTVEVRTPGRLRRATVWAVPVSIATALGFGCACLGHRAAELLFHVG